MIAPAGRARWPPVPDLIEIGDISIADALAARSVALRPETPADEPAVRAIYVAHRDVEFAALPEPLRGSIVNSQFDMQRAVIHLTDCPAHPRADRVEQFPDVVGGHLL